MTKEWTEGRRKSFITSTLRGGFRRYPIKFEVLKEAFVGKIINKKTGRLCSHYRCNLCNELYPTKEVNVDHVIPCIPPETGFTTWDDFIDNLFCKTKENLQVLCSECHSIKSLGENKIRKATKDVNRKQNNKK